MNFFLGNLVGHQKAVIGWLVNYVSDMPLDQTAATVAAQGCVRL